MSTIRFRHDCRAGFCRPRHDVRRTRRHGLLHFDSRPKTQSWVALLAAGARDRDLRPHGRVGVGRGGVERLPSRRSAEDAEGPGDMRAHQRLGVAERTDERRRGVGVAAVAEGDRRRCAAARRARRATPPSSRSGRGTRRRRAPADRAGRARARPRGSGPGRGSRDRPPGRGRSRTPSSRARGRSAGGIALRCSIVRYERQRRGSMVYSPSSAPVGQAATQRVHVPQWSRGSGAPVELEVGQQLAEEEVRARVAMEEEGVACRSSRRRRASPTRARGAGRCRRRDGSAAPGKRAASRRDRARSARAAGRGSRCRARRRRCGRAASRASRPAAAAAAGRGRRA